MDIQDAQDGELLFRVVCEGRGSGGVEAVPRILASARVLAGDL
jgi:hypothetical protein